MPHAKARERSTVETFVLAVLSFLSEMVKMTWGWEMLLFIAMYVMIADLAVRSSWTIGLWRPAKAALLVTGLALLTTVSGESISTKYFEAAARRDPVPWPIQGLTWANYYLDQPRVYLSLSSIALALVLWRFAPVSRFWHRTLFWMRRSLADQVWINREAALKLVMDSRWAATRRSPSSNIWLRMSGGVDITLDDSMFRRWCNQVLDYFISEKNSRTVGDTLEMDETALRRYLSDKYDEAVRKKFGDPY